MRGAHVSLLGGLESRFPSGARGVDVEDRRGPAFLLPAARDLAGRCGEYDRQWLLQASVSRAADGVCCGGPEAPGGEPGGECWITRVRMGGGFLRSKQAIEYRLFASQKAATRSYSSYPTLLSRLTFRSFWVVMVNSIGSSRNTCL